MIKKLFISILTVMPILTFANNSDEPFNPDLRGIIIVHSPKLKKEVTLKNEFIESDEERYVRFLLSLKNNARSEIKSFKGIKDPYDTHLKDSYTNITLSISYKPIPVKNILAYTPIGSYKKGWNGIKVFFNDNGLEACAYSKERILAIQVEKETIEHIINNKLSNKTISGNYDTGFIYNVSWYTDLKDYVIYEQIDCANRKMDKNIIDKMIELANKIDSSN